MKLYELSAGDRFVLAGDPKSPLFAVAQRKSTKTGYRTCRDTATGESFELWGSTPVIYQNPEDYL